METNLYALPDSDLESYRAQIGKAIDKVYERYEDLALEVNCYPPPFDGSEIIRCCLEDDIIVLFKIENDCHVNESKIETLAGIKCVVGTNFTVFLKKALFQMPLERITSAIQLALDEVLFVSQGHSLKMAHELAMQAYQKYPPSVTTDREVNQHLVQEELVVEREDKAKKIVDDPKVKKIEETIPAAKTPKISIPQTEKPKKPKNQRHGRRKKKEGPTKPDRDILEALIINYGGDLEGMAENPNIKTDIETLQSWVDEEGLYELVEQLRRAEQIN